MAASAMTDRQTRFEKPRADGFPPITRGNTAGNVCWPRAAGDPPVTAGAAIRVDGGMRIRQD